MINSWSHRTFLVIAFLATIIANSLQAQGGTAVISLIVQSSARQMALGEAGVTLPGPFCMSYNPALTAYPDANKPNAKVSLGYMDLLPVLNIDNLKNRTIEFPIYNYPGWGAVGFQHNTTNFGENEIDGSGHVLAKFNAYESIYTLNAAINPSVYFFDKAPGQIFNLYTGMNIHFFHSALAPGLNLEENKSDETANGFAFDAGVLTSSQSPWLGLDPFLAMQGEYNIGLALQNVGPSVFYVDVQYSDPLPMTIRVGHSAGLKLGRISIGKYTFGLFQFLFTGDLVTELVSRDKTDKPNSSFTTLSRYITNFDGFDFKRETIKSYGFEIGFFNCLFVQTGILSDQPGLRMEKHSGFGLRLPFPIYGVTLAYQDAEISSEYGGIRRGQKVYNFSGELQF